MRNLLIGTLVALSLGISRGLYAYNQAWAYLEAVRADLPRIDEPGQYHAPTKTRVLADDGTLLTEIYRENREFIPIEQVPRQLVWATIASEDRRFYRHVGVSPFDIARAAVANWRHRQITQGASTITQQLARDLYLSNERTMQRKIKEALLAIELEKRYTKDELLELYLNQINYGRGSYGVKTAARMYFGKEPKDLTLGECAALAAVPRRPASYNLYDDPKGARTRRDKVLDRMVEDGYVTRLVEKPRTPVSNLAVVGVYYLKDWKLFVDCLDELLERDIQTQGEYYLADALQLMIDRGAKISAFPIDVWEDTGTPEALLETNRYLLQGRSVDVEGETIDSKIIPPVDAAPGCRIVNSIVGPNVTIASGAIVLNSIIRDSIVGEGAQVSGAVLADSIIGNNALIEYTPRRLNVSDYSQIEQA